MKNVIILSNPRSGSNYLCSILKNYGVKPVFRMIDYPNLPERYLNSTEIFSDVVMAKLDEFKREKRSIPFDREKVKNYMRRMPKEGAIIKLFYNQIEWSNIDFEEFLEYFKDSKFVMLYRDNILEQVVSLSLCRADKTWTDYDHNNKITLDINKVKLAVKRFNRKFDTLKKWLNKAGIDFEVIKYDGDFAEDDVKRICNFCELPYDVTDRITTTKQRSKDLKDYLTNPEELDNIDFSYIINV